MALDGGPPRTLARPGATSPWSRKPEQVTILPTRRWFQMRFDMVEAVVALSVAGLGFWGVARMGQVHDLLSGHSLRAVGPPDGAAGGGTTDRAR